MTLKKLAAGSGYEYLTRQVAAADSTELGSTPLADYYSARGEAPGRWVGSGLAGIDGPRVRRRGHRRADEEPVRRGQPPRHRQGARPGVPSRMRWPAST